MLTESLKKKESPRNITPMSFMFAEEFHKEIFNINYNPLYTCCVCFGTYVKSRG